MYIGIILHLSFNLMQVHMMCKGVFIKTMNKFNEIGQYIDELWSNRNTDTVYHQKNNEEKDCNVVSLNTRLACWWITRWQHKPLTQSFCSCYHPPTFGPASNTMFTKLG